MSYSSEVLADSPLVFWRLGDSSGTTITDSSGNSRNGTYVNSPTLGATGVPGGGGDTAVTWDGTNDYGRVAPAAWVPKPSSDWSMECWVKYTGTGFAAIAAVKADDGLAAGTTGLLLVGRTAGRIGVETYDFNNVPSRITALQANNDGAFHHVVATFVASTRVLQLWVDGVSQGTATQGTGPNATNRAINIGSNNNAGAPLQYFPGTIDEFALYGSVLSSGRIATHYDTGRGFFTVAAGLISETTTVLAGVGSAAIFGSYGDGVYGDGVYGLGATPPASVIVETTTVLAGAVTAGAVVAAGLIVETTTVLPGVAGEAGRVNGGLVVGSTTVLRGAVVLGYTPTVRNRTSGRRRGGVASAEWEPNVAPVPAGMSLGVEELTALAFNTPTVVNGRVEVVEQKASIRADRHRILVNNVDVTFFRGAATPALDYVLTEPLLYGPATLSLPQVFAAFEAAGVGDLSWLVPGARVKQQRVNAAGVVTATDYKGRIIAFDTSGAEFRAEIGGEASGPAALRERQVPLYRQVKDLGRQIYNALTPLGVRVKPFLGAETGIETVVAGGTGWLDHLHRLHASGQKRNGDMLTTMPNANGVYVTGWKDRTTIDFTVYPHDTQMPANLRRDIAEEPNRVYGTGITPDGMRVLGGVYPGMVQGDAPEYPMADGSSFGVGTTNADTDSGDGVSVMITQLRVHGYVTRDDTPGGYDADVVEGIEALQDAAGLTVTGTMTPATWRALFNLNRTGYSMSWSRVEPMAQKPATRKWRRTADGSVIGRNPNYDPKRLVVDRNVDFGNGFTKGQMRDFAEGEVDHSEDNWVGDLTITTGAVIRGNHVPGTPITEADVMPAADIKPGMNGRLPLFMGGITVHVSGTRSAEGGTRSLHLDTRARDSVAVSQVILRNRETRKNPHRAFVRDHLSSGMVRDAVTEFSEVGGILGGDVRLSAGLWRVFDVPSGRAGLIERLKMVTSPTAEFAVAVFGERISAKKLQAKIGDPLSAPGRAKWRDEDILNELDRDHLLLYVAGGPDARCGYWPHEADGSAILTGVWQDDAGFGYSVGAANMLRVAVCADRDTVIPAGRIMWPQLEPM